MAGWELISLSEDGLEIKLDFNDPIKISGGDVPDILFMQLDLSEFEDADGNKMPQSVVKYQLIPT